MDRLIDWLIGCTSDIKSHSHCWLNWWFYFSRPEGAQNNMRTAAFTAIGECVSNSPIVSWLIDQWKVASFFFLVRFFVETVFCFCRTATWSSRSTWFKFWASWMPFSRRSRVCRRPSGTNTATTANTCSAFFRHGQGFLNFLSFSTDHIPLACVLIVFSPHRWLLNDSPRKI